MNEAVAISDGKMDSGMYRVHIPEKIDVKKIRAKTALSQAEFANHFGLSVYAVRNWEQGKRQPDIAAKAYLKVIDAEREAVERALAS
jgi:putative transcriptional regulator